MLGELEGEGALAAAAEAVREAVSRARHVLLLGAAGTGKTEILARTAAWFASRSSAGLSEPPLVALLPSRPAARRFLLRVMRVAGRGLREFPCLSWEQFCLRTLGRQGKRLLTSAEQRRKVLEVFRSSKREWGFLRQYSPTDGLARRLGDFLLRAEEGLLDPAALEELGRVRGRQDWVDLAALFREYLGVLEEEGAVDSAGVFREVLALLGRENPWAGRLILVDEAEDLSPAKVALLEALARGGLVVASGDPAAATGVFLSPREGLEGLEVALGARLDRVALGRGGSRAGAWKRPGGAPGPPRVDEGGAGLCRAMVFGHPGEEAAWVARFLKARAAQGVPWEEMAVICREQEEAERIQSALAAASVPVLPGPSGPIVRGGWGELLVKVARAARDGASPEVVARSLAPALGFGMEEVRAALRQIRAGSSRDGVEPGGGGDGPEPPLPRPFAEIRELLEEARVALALPAEDGLYRIWKRTVGPERVLSAAERGEAWAVAEAIGVARLFAYARRFQDRRPRGGGDLSSFLDAVRDGEAREEESPAAVGVRVLTPFQAKGLEFEVVVVAGLVERIWPPPGTGVTPPFEPEVLLLDPGTEEGRRRAFLEREERLLYIAASRARREVVFTAYRSHATRGALRISRFLEGVVAEEVSGEGSEEEAGSGHLAYEAELRGVAGDPREPAARRLAAAHALARMDVPTTLWWGGRPWSTLEPVVKPPFQTSFSRLAPFSRCPLSYVYQSELDLDPEASFQMRLGALLHEVIAEVQRRGLSKGAAYERLEEMLAGLPDDLFPNRAVAHARRREAREFLRVFLEMEEKAGTRLLGVEVPFAFDLGPARVVGRIDRIEEVEGGCRVVDYKSSLWEDPSDELCLQLDIYALALLKDPGLKRFGTPKEVALRFPLKVAGKERRGQRATWNDYQPEKGRRPVLRRQWGELEARVARLLEGVASNAFPPSPHDRCWLCRFRVLCPVQPEGEEFMQADGRG